MSTHKPTPGDESFDQFAEDYNKILGEAVSVSGESADHFTFLKVELMKELLAETSSSPGLRFLDYGCGTGRAFSAVDQVFSKPVYVGVDPSPESIRCARESGAGDRATYLLLKDVASVDDSSMDCAFAAVVFHHIPPAARSSAVRTIYDKLKPGGMFFIFEHNPYNPLTRHIVNQCPFDEDAILLPARESRSLLESGGFHDVRTRYYFFFPRSLRGLRPLEVHLGWMPFGGQYVVMGRKPRS